MRCATDSDLDRTHHYKSSPVKRSRMFRLFLRGSLSRCPKARVSIRRLCRHFRALSRGLKIRKHKNEMVMPCSIGYPADTAVVRLQSRSVRETPSRFTPTATIAGRRLRALLRTALLRSHPRIRPILVLVPSRQFAPMAPVAASKKPGKQPTLGYSPTRPNSLTPSTVTV